MTPEIKRLHEARLRAWSNITEISDRVAAEERDFTAEEESAWQAGNADLARIDERLSVLLDAEQRGADIEAALGKYADKPEVPAEVDIETQLRELARGERREVVVAPEKRDLTKGTATAGGNTVPTSFYGQLWEHMIEVSGMLQAGPTVIQTASGESIEVPVTTAHSTSALIAEAGSLTESDPAFAKRTLGAYKYAHSIQVSRELVDDTGVDLLGYLARQSGRSVGNALGAALVTGDGSAKPSGVIPVATAGVTGAAAVAGAFTADNLIDLFYSVISPYRNSPSCGWLMRDATIGAVRKLKDQQDQYLWQPSMQVGAPDVLLGKPVYSDPNVPAVAATNRSVAFGDMSAYFVRLAGGIRFERSDDFAFQNDLVTFRCIVRGDGILADQTGAVKVFVGGAAS